MGSLEPFSKQAVDEMVASRMKDDGDSGLYQGTRRMGLEDGGSTTEQCSVGTRFCNVQCERSWS